MTRPDTRTNFTFRIAEALLAFSARRRGALTLVVGLVAVMGIAALQRLPRDLPPAAKELSVAVEVADPGLPATLMEARVTQPLERAFAAVADVTRIASVTAEGRSKVELVFPPATDVSSVLAGIRGRLAEIELPATVDTPRIVVPPAPAAVELVLVSGSRNPSQLRTWAEENLSPQLVSLPGVAGVRITGGGDREIHVFPDQRRLAGVGLALGSLVRALRAAGAVPPAPSAPTLTPASASAVAALPLRLPNGESIALAEVARVEEVLASGTAGVLSHGLAGIRIDVIPQAGAPPGDVAQRVSAHLSWMRVNGLLPEALELSPAFDAGEVVRASLARSHRAALAGGLLLILIVGAALRRPVSVALTLAMISFAVLTGAVILYLGGQAFDAYTYAGLGLGAATVVGFALRAASIGASPRNRNAVESASSGVVALIAVVSALFAFVFVAGPVGQLYRGLLLAAGGAFVGGVFFALTVIPVALAGRGGPDLKHLVSRRLDRRAVRWRPTRGQQVLTMLGLFAAVAVLWAVARQSPGVASATRAVLEYALPEGEAPAQSADIEREALKLDGVRHVYTAVEVLPALPGAARQLTLRTQLDLSDGNGSNVVAAAALRERLEKSGLKVALRLVGHGGELNRVQVTVSGPDARELTLLGAALAGRMSGIPGVQLLPEPLPPLVPDLVLRLDAVRADALGIDPVEAERVLRIVRSMPVITAFSGGSERRVSARLRAPQEDSEGNSGKILLAGELSDRPVIYLRDIAQVEPAVAPAEIRRLGGVRALSVRAMLAPGLSPAQVQATLRKAVGQITLPAGYAFADVAFNRGAIDSARPLTGLAAAAILYGVALGFHLGRRRLPWALGLVVLVLMAAVGLAILPATGGPSPGAWVALLLVMTAATNVWFVGKEMTLVAHEAPPARRLAAWRAGIGAVLATAAAALILWLMAPIGEARQALGATLLLGTPAIFTGILVALSAHRAGRRVGRRR